MKFNPTAALKTGAVILAVWGLCALDQVTAGGAIPGLGVPGMSEVRDAGLQLSFAPKALPTIEKVEAGSLADITGLKAGDKIKAVNRLTVREEKEFGALFADGAKGNRLIIERDGKTISNLVLGEKPSAPAQMQAAPVNTLVLPLGVNVVDMMGMYPEGVKAPMTMNPEPGSPVDKAGIKAEEWIVAINGKSIATAAEYRRLTEGTEGPLTFTVLNTEKGRHQREVTIR